jgi:hypothetical protein
MKVPDNIRSPVAIAENADPYKIVVTISCEGQLDRRFYA